MTLLRPFLPMLLAMAALSGCVLPGGQAGKGTAQGVAPAEIEVSALPPAPSPASSTPTANDAQPTVAGAPPPAAQTKAEPAPPPATAPEADAAAPPDPAALEEAPPAVVKTPGQIACEKGKGRFVRAGNSQAYTCIRPTRDGGKRCTRAGNCQGVCLARSQTCSPYTPVFGCQEILQDDGQRITECIE